jgi:hypothetical protein
MYQVRVRDGVVRYTAYANEKDARKYLVKGVGNLKGFEVVTETESDFAKRHLKDVIIDIYAADIITDELDVRETLLIPQSKEWFENAKVLLNDSF